MKRLLLICVSLVWLQSLWSQTEYSDVLKLENGHTLVGKITSYTQDSVSLETKEGVRIHLSNHIVKSCRMGGSTVQMYQYKTQKPYARVQGSLLYSPNNTGVSASISGGYVFYRFLSVGIGTGIDNYYKTNGFNSIPVFAEWHGYLLKSNNTPYVAMRWGYSFAIESVDSGFLNPSNHFFYNPTFGIRLGAGAIQTNLFVGAKFQKFSMTTVGENELNVYSINFRRYDIGLAIVF